MKNLILLSISLLIANFIYISPIKAEYKFPWPAGNTWKWSQGWHNTGTLAIDVGTSNNNKAVLAAEDGTVSFVCNDGVSIYIYINHIDGRTMGYFHLNTGKLESNITVNKSIKRGQLLGYLRSGAFNDNGCGYAVQSSTFGHIHWTFQSGIAPLIEGWQLANYPSSIMSKGSQQIYPGANLTSTNDLILRNDTITSSKIYETNASIVISGDGNGYILAPTGSNVITINIL